MRRSLCKHLLRSFAYCLDVRLTEQVDEQDVEHVSGPSLRLWACAGVQLLGNLLVQIRTMNGTQDAQPHRGKSLDSWYHEFNCAPAGWPKIDFNRLPSAGSIPDGYFQAHRIDLVHLQRLAPKLKAELVAAEGNRILKKPQPLRSFTGNTDVDIFGRSCPLGKPQFERDAALEIVAF